MRTRTSYWPRTASSTEEGAAPIIETSSCQVALRRSTLQCPPLQGSQAVATMPSLTKLSASSPRGKFHSKYRNVWWSKISRDRLTRSLLQYGCLITQDQRNRMKLWAIVADQVNCSSTTTSFHRMVSWLELMGASRITRKARGRQVPAITTQAFLVALWWLMLIRDSKRMSYRIIMRILMTTRAQKRQLRQSSSWSRCLCSSAWNVQSQIKSQWPIQVRNWQHE